MKNKCYSITSITDPDNRFCKKEAEFEVSKFADFGHKKALYCAEHAKPYMKYPDGFNVVRINKQKKRQGK